MPRLYVHGPYEFTELRILDPGLRVVASGVKSVDLELPAGIYRVQARVPGAFGERLVSVGLRGDTDDTSITDFSLDLDSPAPVVGVKTYRDVHADAATYQSRSIHVAFSEQQGSQLFVFIRSDGSKRPSTPLLSVETSDGNVIARLDRDGHSDPEMGYGALSIALPAGTYVLVHDAPGLGHRAQAVFAEDGWQTQVFIPWDPDAIDPSRALVSMLPLGHGFDRYRPELYQPVEAALDGLAQGQMVLSPIDEQAFLGARLGDPAFGLIGPVSGLIGAYSYLPREDVDPVRAMVIASTLLKLLPHSPDAHLLYRAACQIGGEAVSGFEPPIPVWAEFDAPPMFAVGTDRLLGQAAEEADLVRTASWLARVAATRTIGSVWTRWDTDLDVGRQTRELLRHAVGDRPVTTDVAEWARRAGLPRSVVEQTFEPASSARAFHLAGGKSGPVAKAGTAASARAPRFQGDTVTSPADLPDYAPIPRSALGPALNDQGYYVGRVERNLYWVTDGVYQSAFLTTPDGVVLFDAPPSIGGNLRRAVDEIAAANGVTNTVTHLVYSHHHADHGSASSLFDRDVVRIGHEETRRLLLRDDDPARPLPEVTFADRYTLEVGGERVELAWHGPNHSPDNIYIHFPSHDTLMFIDVVNAGWVPIYNLNLSEDVIGYMGAPAIALSYPWTHFICGHLGRLATRDDVAVHQAYIADIEASSREALASVNPVPYYVAGGDNAWAGVKGHLDAVTERAAAPVIAKYTGVLAAADIEVFTLTTTFQIMQSLRLDRGPSGPVHP